MFSLKKKKKVFVMWVAKNLGISQLETVNIRNKELVEVDSLVT